MSKILVAYFSCSGHTEEVATNLATIVKGELYKIVPAVPYSPDDLKLQDPKSRTSIEMNDKTSRPKITGKVADMEAYDVVFLGFPIWWYIAPTIINTFLESYDFAGKTVIPFATSGMSDIGDSEKSLYTSCSSETKWRPGKRFAIGTGMEELVNWVHSLKL